MNKIYFALALPALLFLNTACQKDNDISSKGNCIKEETSTYLIEDKTYLTDLYADQIFIRFKNKEGSELSFAFLDKNKNEFSKNVEVVRCTIDTSKEINKDYLMERVSTSLWNTDNKVSFYPSVSLRVEIIPNKKDQYYDQLLVSKVPIGGGNLSSIIRILVNKRSAEDILQQDFNQSVSTVKILDKSFSDVFISDDSSLYFSMNQGIVAFKDSTGELWQLE